MNCSRLAPLYRFATLQKSALLSPGLPLWCFTFDQRRFVTLFTARHISMDYLLAPLHPLRSPIEVPCLAYDDYDGGSLEEFPSRAGWTPRIVEEWHQIFRIPSRRFQAFLHTWRFFGLIETVFRFEDGRRPCLADLTRQLDEPSRTIVNTSKLSRLAEAWAKSISLENETSASQDLVLAIQSLNYSLRIEAIN